MHCVIYLDVVFAVNFVLDYVVLMMAEGIMNPGMRGESLRRYGVRYLRRILAAGLGGGYVCVLVAFRLDGWWWSLVSYLVVSAMMVFVITEKISFVNIVKGVGILYLSALVLGGALHMIYYFTDTGFLINAVFAGMGVPVKMEVVLGGSVVVAPGIKILFGLAGKKTLARRVCVELILAEGERKVRLNALVDTGNGLRDPVFGGAVNVVEKEAADRLLKGKPGRGYHLIPFSSIGEKNGVIPVVRLEKMSVLGMKKKLEIREPLFALYSGRLSKEGEFEAILHPKMLEGLKFKGDGV